LLQQVIAVLGIDRKHLVDASWADNGPGWIAVLLEDAAAVLAVEPDFSRFAGDGYLKIGLVGPHDHGTALSPDRDAAADSLDIGLVGPYPEGSACAFEVRALSSDGRGGMLEDPVTGSLNASLAQWLLATGRATAPFVTSQGTRLGREGRPRIDQDSDGTVWVGGNTTTCIAGEIEI
jgi:predicted PhzF superfamily epimerase YddE/YHI9